jgi:hypothetical protein
MTEFVVPGLLLFAVVLLLRLLKEVQTLTSASRDVKVQLTNCLAAGRGRPARY